MQTRKVGSKDFLHVSFITIEKVVQLLGNLISKVATELINEEESSKSLYRVALGVLETLVHDEDISANGPAIILFNSLYHIIERRLKDQLGKILVPYL